MSIQNELNRTTPQDNIETLVRNGSLIIADVFTNEEIEEIEFLLFEHFKTNDQQDP
jgi:hypothetical protein